jgi:hypothetical protein
MMRANYRRFAHWKILGTAQWVAIRQTRVCPLCNTLGTAQWVAIRQTRVYPLCNTLGTAQCGLPFDKPGDIHCVFRCYSQRIRYVRPSSVEFVMGSFGIRLAYGQTTSHNLRGSPCLWYRVGLRRSCTDLACRMCSQPRKLPLRGPELL